MPGVNSIGTAGPLQAGAWARSGRGGFIILGVLLIVLLLLRLMVMLLTWLLITVRRLT